MTQEPNKLEEKLVPYLEGVLNPKERREVDEAIGKDGELAREMSELREIILELRQGFASGLKPVQEELSVEDVVELGLQSKIAVDGSSKVTDGVPGTSQQKARLFCSDSALEEYSLLRALQEEMARTTLDRENIPELPESLRKEFRGLKVVPISRKLLPFAPRMSPKPLWRKASGLLDRIDPKPLMASAAALMMLSLGVHFYNRPGTSVASDRTASEIGYNFSDEKTSSTATPAPPPRESSGVAVFTSDDRSLLKEQAEKLLSKKVRYTVTNDRILVAEKDVDEARGILWKDIEGKAVAVASEQPAAKSLPQQSAGASPEGGSAPVVYAEEALASEADNSEVVYYSAPSRSDAPAAPAPPTDSGTRTNPATSAPRSAAPKPAAVSSSKRDPAAELAAGVGRAEPQSIPAYRVPSLKSSKGQTGVVPGYRAPEPTVIDPEIASGEVAPPVSPERRQKIRDLALGRDDQSSADNGVVSDKAELEGSVAESSNAPAPTTVTVNRARVAAAPPQPVAASAPVANVITAPGVGSAAGERNEEAPKDTRLARVESSRQAVAKRHNVEISLDSKDGRVAVYVRAKESLSKAELDELRKALRKELGLSDSDTIIFR